MQKVVVHLHELYQKCKDYVKTFNVVQLIIVHEFSLQYKGAPLELRKKTRQEAQLEKEKVQILIQNNKQLASFIANTQAHMHDCTTTWNSW